MAEYHYHYGMTIKEGREAARMTQTQLADMWPRADGGVGVSVDYVYLVEAGKKHITDPGVLRTLCDILNLPYWKMGFSEYDPFHPDRIATKDTSMYNETLNTAESLIKRTWHLRRMAPLDYVEESVEHLNRLFAYLRENMPPPSQLEINFQILYAQVLRLNAVMDVEHQRYTQALENFERMYEIAKKIDHGATLAIALLGVGTELERAGKQEEAVEKLEAARDESFRASKQVSALVNAYLARAYASNHQPEKFKKAIQTAIKVAEDVKLYYGDGTDFVFHSLSGILAERSYGYVEIGEPQETLNMKDRIREQIKVEGNVWLDAWVPLDWARAYFMLGDPEKSVEAGLEFYTKASILKSPHAKSRAYRLLNTLEGAGYAQAPAVKRFKALLDQDHQKSELKELDATY